MSVIESVRLVRYFHFMESELTIRAPPLIGDGPGEDWM